MSQFEITRGPRTRPVIGLVYGPPGVGKTHFASQFSKNSVVTDLENGSDFLDVNRVKLQAYDEVVAFLVWVSKSGEFDAVVIDSITALERIAVNYVVSTNNWNTIEDVAYGKGWAMYRSYMARICRGIEYIRDAGKSVILVGHSQVKAVNDPSQNSYERMEYNIDPKMQPLLTSIVDFCFYLRPQVRTLDEKSKTKALANGTRELITTDRGGSLAKNRFAHLDEIIEFPAEKDTKKLNAMYSAFWASLMNAKNER